MRHAVPEAQRLDALAIKAGLWWAPEGISQSLSTGTKKEKAPDTCIRCL